MNSANSLNHYNGGVRSGYTMVIMAYEGEELRETMNVVNVWPSPTVIAEFTPRKVEDIGKTLKFRIFDATSYTKGMDTLSLLVRINDGPARKVIFPTALSNTAKVGEFTVPFYKSVLIEFDVRGMRNRDLV